MYKRPEAKSIEIMHRLSFEVLFFCSLALTSNLLSRGLLDEMFAREGWKAKGDETINKQMADTRSPPAPTEQQMAEK